MLKMILKKITIGNSTYYINNKEKDIKNDNLNNKNLSKAELYLKNIEIVKEENKGHK